MHECGPGCPVCDPVHSLDERPPCGWCGGRDGAHQQHCRELRAMLDIQAMQEKNRETGCSHAYPMYADGRCMGCGYSPK